MRHPHVDFRIPPRFVALLDWLLEGYDPEEGVAPYEHAASKISGWLYEIDGFLLAARASFPMVDDRPEGELTYDNHPLEVIPFAYNGGDGLLYAWALLAPELDLDELPCVSFAPEWDQAIWLGDDVKSALETLLVGYVRDLGVLVERPQRAALCRAVGLAPDFARKDVSSGAWVGIAGDDGQKCPRRMSPVVPAGYRFEATSDGIGVLAPSSAFAPGPFDRSELEDEETTLAMARSFLSRGQPASALVALKQGYFEETPKPIVEMQREVFLALGRPALAARATSWLARREK